MKYTPTSIEADCDCNEKASICAMVDVFAEEMKKELLEKVGDKHGWASEDWHIRPENTSEMETDGDTIVEQISWHIEKNRPIGIANFACFWWNKIEEQQ